MTEAVGNVNKEAKAPVAEKEAKEAKETKEPKAPNGGLLEGDATGGVPCIPGRLAGAYDVGKAVGKGGYAIVYKGIRHEDGRVIAVKKVEVFEMTQKKRERCLQEVKLLQQLTHPYVIQMLDAFIDENMLIIIFEWAPAGDLKRLIKKTAEAGRTLDEASIWAFFAQITDALRYMHQHRIMHRDIKPANVLVGANGALKLADLGLGRQLSEQTMEAFSKVGTPYYVSPEVVRGAGYDWKSDIWSMGCLLYELACLKSPFEHRMLSVEPAKRPDLEEVWAITTQITQSQGGTSRQDVHSLSEHLYSRLTLLEAFGTAEPPKKESAKNGKHAGGGGGLAHAPVEALRSMHPLYMAEKLGHLTARNADENQKKQLGVFMAVFAWLVKLNGKPELAAAIEQHIEQVPVPGRARAQPPAQPPPPASAGKSPGRSSRSTKVAANPTAAELAHGLAPGPPDTTPSCTSLLKGAEAVKKAAQGLGMSTEFAPVNALATGYGRAVCAVMAEALEQTSPSMSQSLEQSKLRGDEEEEEAELGYYMMGDDALQRRALGPTASFSGRGEPDSGHHQQRHRPGSADKPSASSSAPGSRTGTPTRRTQSREGGARTQTPDRSHKSRMQDKRSHQPAQEQTQIDPIAWKMELERLGPQLRQIKISADSDAAADWHYRWERLKEQTTKFTGDSKLVGTPLQGVSGTVGHDLERIETSERHVNNKSEGLLEQYRTARARLVEISRETQQQEELSQIGNYALEQIDRQLHEMQDMMQERAASISSSTHVKNIQEAIHKLVREMKTMDVRIGVVQQQLMSRHRKQIMGNLTWDEDDMMYDDV
eukprot:gene23850-9406_t